MIVCCATCSNKICKTDNRIFHECLEHDNEKLSFWKYDLSFEKYPLYIYKHWMTNKIKNFFSEEDFNI